MTRLIKHLPFNAAFLLTIGLATIPATTRAQSEPQLPPKLPNLGTPDSFALAPSPPKHFNLWQFVKSNSLKIDPLKSTRSIELSNTSSAPTDADLLVFADRYSFIQSAAFTLDRSRYQSGAMAIVPAHLDLLLFGDGYTFTGNVESATVAKPFIPATPVKKPTTVATNILPTIADINLVLKLKERRVYVYHGQTVLTSYPVGVGRKGRETPTGEWQVMETIVNPGWTDFNTGRVIPPGKNNPMGSRWIGFWTDGQDMIGFHGTNKVASIGKAVSSGCVRMIDRDVQEMYKYIKVGTIVRVVDE